MVRLCMIAFGFFNLVYANPFPNDWDDLVLDDDPTGPSMQASNPDDLLSQNELVETATPPIGCTLDTPTDVSDVVVLKRNNLACPSNLDERMPAKLARYLNEYRTIEKGGRTEGPARPPQRPQTYDQNQLSPIYDEPIPTSGHRDKNCDKYPGFPRRVTCAGPEWGLIPPVLVGLVLNCVEGTSKSYWAPLRSLPPPPSPKPPKT